MIKVSLKEVINSQMALQELMTQPLPSSLSYKISRLSKSIKSELETFEETRIEICNRLGEKSEDDKSYVIKDENKEEFTSELNNLINTEIELPGEKIQVEQLSDRVELSPFSFLQLDWLIKE
jgi:hypothetical protein